MPPKRVRLGSCRQGKVISRELAVPARLVLVLALGCACAVACGGSVRLAATPSTPRGLAGHDGSADSDNDHDGILDADDRCPNDPEDKDGHEDAGGCPDPDHDNDRIADVDDDCPNDPEVYNGYEDADGCPDTTKITDGDPEYLILDRVNFAPGKAEILPTSFPMLDALAASLVGNPQITLVEIQGHADARGSDDYNIKLTADRAAAVKHALIERGVDGARLRSAGYGSRCPIDRRDHSDARESNRRVEFKIIQSTHGRHVPIPVICPAGRELMPQ